MARSERLLELLQVLRRYRQPVSGAVLARETDVSLRTLYRDIASLQAQGAEIAGEPGVGYVLKPGFLLPPLMFSEEEIEALVLGSRWVQARAGPGLEQSAANALAKIAAVLPTDLRESVESSTLLIGPSRKAVPQSDLTEMRRAIRLERKMELSYRDGGGGASRRIVWPFALGFFEEARVLVGWCELRQDFRHFRADRIAQARLLEKRYPRRRQAMLKAWLALQKRPR